jgi:penicillin-binding protein 2
MVPILSRSTKKIIILALGTCIAMGLIIMRLYELQVLKKTNFFTLGQKNFLRVEKVYSHRGNILDTKGKLLATNRPITNLFWQGSSNPRLTPQQENALAELDFILGTTLAATVKECGISATEKLGKKILIAQDLTFEQLSRISEKFADHENIQLATHFKRLYPHNALACHILGYLGHIDYGEEGKMGLEKILEEQLKGKTGEVQKIINSLGKNLAEKELTQSLAGCDIQTTLDLDLQQIAERVFSENYVGTFILMDPKTGALRAVVSRPNFDPNIFLQTIDQQNWEQLQASKAFLNRAFNACYPPASIFKLVTVSAALEKKIINPQAQVFCKGFYQFGTYKHWCINHTGHGVLTVMQAVAKSCNILFYHIGKHVGIDTLAEYAQRFGLGQKTNMIFPDQAGLVPTSNWKLMAKGERWWPGETLSAAIGQSFLLTTPIQLARMISGIFEEYLVTPRIIEQEPIEKETLRISKSTLDFLRKSMRSVVQIGTGMNVSHMRDIEVYAKTGTAQTSSLKLRESNEKFMENGLFVGYFKYKREAPLTMVILVERAGSSRVATNLGKEFLIAYRSLLEKDLPQNLIAQDAEILS